MKHPFLLSAAKKAITETKGKPDIETQTALIKAFPYHPNAIDAWKEYGQIIFDLSGRSMFGHNYIKSKK